MKIIIQIFALLLFTTSCTKEPVSLKITNLKLESKETPLGVDISDPRFSWNLESKQRGIHQKAYQILVATSDKFDDDNLIVWDSKKVSSDSSIQIYYEGKTLVSNKKYYWKIYVWDQNGGMHTSSPTFWTTGLFQESDWKAKWIGLDKAVGNDAPDAPRRILSARMLRKEFNLNKEIKNATVFISGLGLYELSINGKIIGDQVLAPGLTEYNKTAFYNTFDITKHLQSNKNTIGIILGNGRYFAPRTDHPNPTRTYGFPKAICQIEIEFKDGTKETVITDTTWKLTTNGPIRKNNEYDGEFYDARMEMNGWDKTNYNDSEWITAELVEKPGDHLISQPNEPIRIMEELDPISVKEIEPGVYIFDMGQNMVGWTELFVKGKKGDQVSLKFAETLNDDGTLFLRNLRGAKVTDTYILKGEEKETWEPKFTYHGFRFVEIKGYPGTPTLKALKGKVVHDDLELSGSFESSNSLINNIYKNSYWGIRGNYRSIPTDCPQRDERQGWLGDRSAESIGESFIFNISNLYAKWVYDMKDAQKDNGSIPDVAPSYWPNYTDNTTWPGTYLFASDMLYSQYGDLKIIKTNYPNMQKWITYMEKYVKDGIMTKDTYGDWCSPPEDPKLIHTLDPLRTTSSEFLGTAYYYAEIKLMAKFAKLLGKDDDAAKYLENAGKMKKVFNDKFFDKENVQYSNNSHTVNILAMAFDLVPEKYRDQINERLLQKILGESNGHVGNGIIGGQWLMRTLTNNGHADVAYSLAAQNTYPSWGYMVGKGATTIWELWNGDTGDPGMNSGNHVMLLGDLIIWFYEDLAGIKADPEIPAFKHIIMKPNISNDLTYVNASYQSVYGAIKSFWKRSNKKFTWDISIPANTTATIYIPVLKNEKEVKESGEKAKGIEGLTFIRMVEGKAVFTIESGSYSFTSDANNQFEKTKGYTATPFITPKGVNLKKGDQITIAIKCEDENAVIHYTLDGSKPEESSPVFIKPFEINKSTTVKAKAFKEGDNPSVQTISIYDFIDVEKNGIHWEMYRGDYLKMPNFNKLKPKLKGYTHQLTLNNEVTTPIHFFGLRYKTYIKIDKPGLYKFYTSSNDGSKLYINGELIVDNDGLHGPVQKSGDIQLTKGMHEIQVDYFQGGGSKVLMVYYSSKGLEYQPIPGSVLFKKR